jgi:flagellar hook-basal body complex protein FliE
MSTDAISTVAGIAVPSLSPRASSSTAATGGEDFAKWMVHEMHGVNDRISSAEGSLTQLATGQTGNLHEVMLDLEKARLSFQLAVQVRNKLLEGYQDIMRMQI